MNKKVIDLEQIISDMKFIKANEIDNKERITPAQMSFIDSLYERLGVRFKERQRPQTKKEASILIDSLQDRLDQIETLSKDFNDMYSYR